MAIMFGPRSLMTIYWLLFVGTVYVNKYVLSVLKFTYPTIFQGWQTLFGAGTMFLLSLTGKLDLKFSEINRRSIAIWIPAMMLFVGSIYSGSVALSILPVPIFICLQNILLLPAVVSDIVHESHMTKKTSAIKCAMIGTIIISSVAVCNSDPQFVMSGYLWMLVHLSLSGSYMLYQRFTKKHVKLREYEQIFCNYTYSMIMLVPCSFLLGDALAARRFPFLYFSKFYIGCLLSGVGGVMLNVIGATLSNNQSEGPGMEQNNTVARCFCATLSLLFFKITLTAPLLLWIIINLLAAVMYFELPNLLNPKSSQAEDTPT